jgi:hypothetical protein
VYVSYILWKKDQNKKLLEKRYLFIPSIISFIILFSFFFSESQKPIDIRKNEYTALGMKHYIHWETRNATSTTREVFVGVYKKDDRYFEFEISKPTYYYFKNLWKKQEIELTKDDSISNISFLEWDKNPKNALVYTKMELFTNYFKNSMGLYDYHVVNDVDVKELNLYSENRIDYINSQNILEPRQSLIYGINVSDSVSRIISNLSSLDSEFRPILLVWVDKNKEMDWKKTICYQRSYWGGGKNNEVVFCVGINNITEKKILWSGSFSWAITHDFENYVKSTALKPGQVLNSKSYSNAIISGYSKNYWDPRKFETYTVLSYPIMDFTIILVCVMIIILNFILVRMIKR